MAASGTTSRRWGWAIGALATLVGITLYLAGWLDRLDGYNLDLNFRHFNTLQADPRIVLIDIDDSTLQAMPDWPWPRRVFADLVRTIDEFEPDSIALDIVFDLPSTSRSSDSRDGTDSAEDEALALAMRHASNVFLAMPARIGKKAELTALVRSQPAEQAEAKSFLAQRPHSTASEFIATVDSQVEADAITPRRESLKRAFASARAIRAVLSRCHRPPFAMQIQDDPPIVLEALAPIESLVRSAMGTGMVSFQRGDASNIIRRLPMYCLCDDRMVAQLGVLAARHAQGLSDNPGEPDGPSWGHLREGSVRDQLSRIHEIHAGRELLLNWVKSNEGRDWRSTFVHIPCARVMEIIENRRAMNENDLRFGTAMGELVKLRFADAPGVYDDYAKRVNAQIEVERRRAETRENRTLLADSEIARLEGESVEWLRRAWGLWKDEAPRNDDEAGEREQIKRLYDRLGEGQYAARLDAANRTLEERNADLIAELRPVLEDKVVLVGYTATAMADMVPTPVDPAMPGVMVHANVVNMFLQNRFVTAADEGGNLLLMLLSGAITTLAAVRGRTRASVGVLAVVIITLLGGGAILFYRSTYHVASLATVVCVLLTWGCVTVYRQSTDERSRRKLQRALSQYTSPAVATRIAGQARGDTLAPQTARVTCFFSDLSGFTALSERLGPQRTREALDPYLCEVSAVIMAQNGMVNKFIGDGVFAFFNAPILPCPNHAAAACEAALQAVEKSEVAKLAIRVGLSTGDAFVGDYGSEQKLDYTCIGDTVNVGQRLERANKFFGTSILVGGFTRQAAGASFVFRPLGLIAVPGRSEPVSAYGLVGRSGEVSAEAIAAIERFDEAIHCFQTCQWDSCLSLLSQSLRIDPVDQAAKRYQYAAQRFKTTAPPPGWNGAIDATDL